ncbi:hypothetical protein [Methylacidimicrobium sp. B4]|uniref:hypothetical protein n=1 Tax=Methylacidimicrobium sp. B4 TaxID=2796139 RepID=UPI001A8C2015|nr:hypothetical protein [Methylacidimicrobium sp. B4]QSR85433.1 hypothetical protein MacB4_04145 [Methylacidimicrobium sp. B4]
MGRSAKKEDESNGENRPNVRLLRGWVHALPYWEEIRSEKGFGLGEEAGPAERAIEETLLLQEEIESAQRMVREWIGAGSEGASWLREEGKEVASENDRLWRAVGHLAEELDRLSEKLEILERRHPSKRARGSRPLTGQRPRST